ncbi:MAG: hypothetical protein SFY80_09485 [Verrucomicrobiota bacterium]|nr:hypothetical protein [Verrucomicrobiota bacterium]
MSTSPLLEGLQRISALLAEYPLDLNEVKLTVLSSILHGFELSDLFLFRRRGEQSLFLATAGIGPHATGLVHKLSFDENDLDALALASKGDQPILLEDVAHATFKHKLPGWLMTMNPGGVLLAPIPDEPHNLALLLGFTAHGTCIQCDTTSLQRLNALGLALAVALRKAPQA